ncbi:hypothetical protein DFH27DRAFT_572432 [Peziza echinospora]|nr:hypothetical protein DFH27DRAFT_572432 [Peziza echinospora]
MNASTSRNSSSNDGPADNTRISSPPQLELKFDGMTLHDDDDGFLGSRPAGARIGEPGYDMVDYSGDEPTTTTHSAGPRSPLSDAVIVQRYSASSSPDIPPPRPWKGGHGASSREEDQWQLDGAGGHDGASQQSRGGYSESSDEPPYSRPTGGLRVCNQAPTPEPQPQASYFEHQQPNQPHKEQQKHKYEAYSVAAVRPSPQASPQYEDHSSSMESKMFDDFDGVHCELDLQLSQPKAAPPPPSRPQRMSTYGMSHQEQQQSRGMVYYPAPVPAMLKLPPTLSKPKTNRESQILNNRKSMQVINNRQSVMRPQYGEGPGGEEESAKKKDFRRSVAGLPPQLRASVFFDQPVTPEIELDGNMGAVEALDNILDASAKAPPVAFTDHPIAAGPAFQSPMHARSRSSVMLNNRQSTATLGQQVNNRHSVANMMGGYRSSVALGGSDRPQLPQRDTTASEPPLGAGAGHDYFAENTETMQERDYGRPDSQVLPPGSQYYLPQNDAPPSPNPDHNALPTTLLAELESRKAQLRSRNRTAASSFPTGMRSTLLELDAVAQVQKETRRNRRTNLAWENEVDIDGREADEDVPLGVLFAGQNHGQNATRLQHMANKDEDVPLGLIMKREIEDNEPLSKRKERLKSHSTGGTNQEAKRSTVFLEVPGLTTPGSAEAEDEENEDESLGDRMKRLQAQRSTSFGTGSLGLNLLDNPDSTASSSPTKDKRKTLSLPPMDAEETLGQRRRRLQAEKEKEKANGGGPKRESVFLQHEVKHRRSMMDIIQHQQSMPLHLRSQSSQMVYPGHQPNNNNNGMGMQLGNGSGLINYSNNNHSQSHSNLNNDILQYNLQFQQQQQQPQHRQQSTGLVGGIMHVNTAPNGMGMLGMGQGMGMGMPGYNRASTMMGGAVGGATYGAALQQMQMQMQMPTPIQNTKQMEMVERWRSSVLGGATNPS